MAMRVQAIPIHAVAGLANQDVPRHDFAASVPMWSELELAPADIAGDHYLEAAGGFFDMHN
jgi:hypothetical protein